MLPLVFGWAFVHAELVLGGGAVSTEAIELVVATCFELQVH